MNSIKHSEPALNNASLEILLVALLLTNMEMIRAPTNPISLKNLINLNNLNSLVNLTNLINLNNLLDGQAIVISNAFNRTAKMKLLLANRIPNAIKIWNAPEDAGILIKETGKLSNNAWPDVLKGSRIIKNS